MLRSELIQALATDCPELTTKEVETLVSTFFEAIVARLASGGRVELRGFGTFCARSREARTGRNPRTGTSVQVKAKRVVYFKLSKEMRARLNTQRVVNRGTRALQQRAGIR